ncbi:hypothetical protein PSY31_23875, partial [Shigella flexneri]|nr:hypothetical protein [Shigella flexneri]
HFEPVKLLVYIRELAPHASSGVDRLDLTIARSQLSAFCHFKGYRSPAQCLSSKELLQEDLVTQQISDETVASENFEHTPS